MNGKEFLEEIRDGRRKGLSNNWKSTEVSTYGNRIKMNYEGIGKKLGMGRIRGRILRIILEDKNRVQRNLIYIEKNMIENNQI